MDINNKILEKLNEARKVALDELIAQALKILNQYKEDYEECVIAMGSLFFTTTSDTRKYGSLTFSDGDLTHEYFKPLVDIIKEWDDLFKLTDEGVRFKADGILKYNW